MHKLLKYAIIAALTFAPLPNVNAAGWLPLAKSSSGCSQATTFISRTSGLSGTETTAYTNLICGLVTDGVITGTVNGANSGAGACGSTLDALYIFATNTTTTANLNLCGTSYGLTTTAAPSFTADQGYTGNGTTQFLSTNFNPNTATTPNYVLNSASLGAYVRTNRTTAQNYVSIGAGGTAYAYVQPLNVAATASVDMNGFSFPTFTVTTAQGFLVASRTNGSNTSVFRNASSTDLGPLGDISTSVPIVALSIGALNDSSSGNLDFSTDQISAAYIGAGVSGATHLLISNRINAYMTALGVNVY